MGRQDAATGDRAHQLDRFQSANFEEKSNYAKVEQSCPKSSSGQRQPNAVPQLVHGQSCKLAMKGAANSLLRVRDAAPMLQVEISGLFYRQTSLPLGSNSAAPLLGHHPGRFAFLTAAVIGGGGSGLTGL